MGILLGDRTMPYSVGIMMGMKSITTQNQLSWLVITSRAEDRTSIVNNVVEQINVLFFR